MRLLFKVNLIFAVVAVLGILLPEDILIRSYTLSSKLLIDFSFSAIALYVFFYAAAIGQKTITMSYFAGRYASCLSSGVPLHGEDEIYEDEDEQSVVEAYDAKDLYRPDDEWIHHMRERDKVTLARKYFEDLRELRDGGIGWRDAGILWGLIIAAIISCAPPAVLTPAGFIVCIIALIGIFIFTDQLAVRTEKMLRVERKLALQKARLKELAKGQ